MLDAFDPASRTLAKPYVAAFELSDDAERRLDARANVRNYVDRLLADGLAVDAITVIARALPVQFVVPWCCECIRSALPGAGPALEVERAAVQLAEQCLQDPSDANRQMCLEFALRAKRATAGAWLATAAAWADGPLTAPDAPVRVDAPPHAVAAAVVAALRLAAAAAPDGAARLAGFATRALALFGPRMAAGA